LDYEVENRPAFIGSAEKIGGKNEVPGARHRQELGEALDDAEDRRCDEFVQRLCSLEAARGMLEHCISLRAGYTWEPLQELLDRSTTF
jgi:hypothetical protein